MSHHFDTKLAKDDPSLNICDFYLFEGPPGRTVMAMTLNPDVGPSAPNLLHTEGLYASFPRSTHPAIARESQFARESWGLALRFGRSPTIARCRIGAKRTQFANSASAPSNRTSTRLITSHGRSSNQSG